MCGVAKHDRIQISFNHTLKKPFENFVGKEKKILKSKHFNNIYFVVCKCFEFGRVQNFVVWLKV